MKKNLLLLFLLSVSIFSCSKKSSSGPNYQISGVQDVTLQNKGTATPSNYQMLSLAIAPKNSTSDQETVTLTITGLPDGIVMNAITSSSTGTITSTTNGTVPFATVLTFYDTTTLGAPAGVYPITVTCDGSKSGNTNYKFNMTILAGPAIATSLAATYAHCDLHVISGTMPSASYVDVVTVDPSYNNKIWFSNFYNTGQKIYGVVTEVSGQTFVNIPNQTVNGYAIVQAMNTGYYLNQSFNWNMASFQITNNGNTSVCSAFMQR